MNTYIERFKLQYKLADTTQRLIYWNCLCFILSLLFFYSFKSQQFHFSEWIALVPTKNTLFLKPYTLFTYMFLHAGFLHLLFNMIMLHFAGRLFVTFFTQKQLLGTYILGGLFSGFIFVIAFLLMGKSALLVGASGAVMALLIAVTVYAPYMNLRLALVGNVKLWLVTAVLLFLDLVQIGFSNTGGHLAHLAGAFFGYLFVYFLRKGTDITAWVSKIELLFTSLFTKKKSQPFKKVHRTKKATPTNNVKSPLDKTEKQKQIDVILDKISQSGYDALTKEEKAFLFKAGN